MRKILVLVLMMLVNLPAAGGEVKTLRVMSLNVWHKEHKAEDQAALVKAIMAGRADIVGFQEINKEVDGKAIAKALGMFYDHGSRIMSKYKIVGDGFEKGVKIKLSEGQAVYLFNVHLRHYDYGPYQLAGIPYSNHKLYDPKAEGSVERVIADQVRSRGKEIAGTLAEMGEAIKSGLPVFLTGDFNEPSHLDWTEGAVKADLHPVVVPWPTSVAVLKAGLKDSYRALHVDEVKATGHTWSPVYGADTRDNDGKKLEPQDRIDFVYYAGTGVKVKASETVGPVDGISGIEVVGYPTDHRGVVTAFGFGGEEKAVGAVLNTEDRVFAGMGLGSIMFIGGGALALVVILKLVCIKA